MVAPGVASVQQLLKRCASLVLRSIVPLGIDDWSDGPRPPGRTVVHAPGVNSQRILMLGGGPAVGYGVGTHDLALAGHLVRAISVGTRCGTDIEVFAKESLTASGARLLVDSIFAERFDAVVLTIGVQDAITFADSTRFEREMRVVLADLTARAALGIVLFLVAIPPISKVIQLPRMSARLLDRSAERLNRTLMAIAASEESIVFVPFSAPFVEDGARHRGSSTYRLWAKELAATIVPVLFGRRGRDRPALDEQARQSALDRLNILDTEPEERFDRITALAQRYFGTAGAAISLVDRDRQWFKSRRGLDVSETARSESLCEYTIRGNQTFVVTDVLADARFAQTFIARSAQRFRSYAGFPLESPEGNRIGAICVFDTKPRTFSAEEIVFLRELAHLAQEQLWIPSTIGLAVSES